MSTPVFIIRTSEINYKYHIFRFAKFYMDSATQTVWVTYGKGRAVKMSVSSDCDVNDLIKIIKLQLSPKLDAIAVDEITLHSAEGEASYPANVSVSTILDGVVGKFELPIIVKSLFRTAKNDPSAVLGNYVHKALTASEQWTLCNDGAFAVECANLCSGTFNEKNAIKLYRKLHNCVRTSTQLDVAHGKYVFDGIISSEGQAKTTLQFVAGYTQILCAKVGLREQIVREAEISKSIWALQICPSVMPVLDVVSVPRKNGEDDGRTAMITPYYPRSIDNFAVELLNGHPVIVANIALCGIATVLAFSRCGFGHCDLKPKNMMLSAMDDTVVTIDFGESCKFGKTIRMTTAKYAMGVVAVSSVKYDLTCLAAVLIELTENLKIPETVGDALRVLRQHTSLAAKLALTCLDASENAEDASKNAEEVWDAMCKIIREAGILDDTVFASVKPEPRPS